MSTSGNIGAEIDKRAALANAAIETIFGAGTTAKQSLPGAVLEMLGAYSAALYIAERVVQSATFNVELVQALHSKLLPFERIADRMLTAARRQGYFDDPETAVPLGWLEACNEQVKDCMVALESMLDPQLDDLMATAMDEHKRGETVRLDSIR